MNKFIRIYKSPFWSTLYNKCHHSIISCLTRHDLMESNWMHPQPFSHDFSFQSAVPQCIYIANRFFLSKFSWPPVQQSPRLPTSYLAKYLPISIYFIFSTKEKKRCCLVWSLLIHLIVFLSLFIIPSIVFSMSLYALLPVPKFVHLVWKSLQKAYIN